MYLLSFTRKCNLLSLFEENVTSGTNLNFFPKATIVEKLIEQNFTYHAKLPNTGKFHDLVFRNFLQVLKKCHFGGNFVSLFVRVILSLFLIVGRPPLI